MRKGGLENVADTIHIDGNTDKGKQRITHLTRLCKWLPEHILGDM